MREKVRAFVREHDMLREGDRLIVSVSGGVDSMTLLTIMHQFGYPLVCIHFNHERRGCESERDAAVVARYCERLGIAFVGHRLGPDLRSLGKTRSLQEAARKLRYQILHREAIENGIQCVAVGHNRDDQAETVLLNLRRGSGLDGVAGMRPVRTFHPEGHTSLIRPFLGIRRKEIELYATNNEIPWSEDASNESLRYVRNRIRHKMIPGIEMISRPGRPGRDGQGHVFVGTGDFIDEVADAAAEMMRVVDHDIPASLPDSLRNWHEFERCLPIDAVESLPEVIRSWLFLRAVRRWLPGAPARSATVSSMEALLRAQPGRKIRYETGLVWRERNFLRFEATLRPGLEFVETEEEDIVLVPGSRTRIDRSDLTFELGQRRPDMFSSTGNVVYLDFAKVTGPLRTRRWRAGDRFVPLGMNGHKKVKSYLTDIKVETSRRERALVVCDDEKIVWLVGLRLDDRVRLDEESQYIARISVAE